MFTHVGTVGCTLSLRRLEECDPTFGTENFETHVPGCFCVSKLLLKKINRSFWLFTAQMLFVSIKSLINNDIRINSSSVTKLGYIFK